MTQILSIEWLKIRRYRTFWVIAGLFIVLFPLMNQYGKDIFGKDASRMLFDTTASFSTIWHNTCFYAGHFVIFISLLMAILTCNEYQYKTHRQNVIDGWKRTDFLHAKWALAIVLAVATTVFAALIGLITGLIQGASFSYITDGLVSLLWLFILSLNYYGFGLMLAILLRRAGLTVILLLVYYMMIEPLAHGMLFYEAGIRPIDYFLPLESSDQLLPFPKLSSMADQMADNASKEIKTEKMPKWSYAIASMCWVVVYYIGGRTRLMKSDW